MKWVRYRGWRLEQEQEEGEWVRVRMRMRFDVEEEAVQFAMSLRARVVEPGELRDAVAAAARKILAAIC